MKKVLVTFLFLILALAACRKSEDSSNSSIFSTDEKDEAAKIVDSANQDLKKVRTIYKENENRVETELIPAMSSKDVGKVKAIADDLVNQINNGMESAKEAIKKLEEAENMNINDTYKEYLGYKKEGLLKQIEAFKLRHQLAREISASFGGTDPAKIAQLQNTFKEKEASFHKLIKEGEELSERANQIYKDSLKNK